MKTIVEYGSYQTSTSPRNSQILSCNEKRGPTDMRYENASNFLQTGRISRAPNLVLFQFLGIWNYWIHLIKIAPQWTKHWKITLYSTGTISEVTVTTALANDVITFLPRIRYIALKRLMILTEFLGSVRHVAGSDINCGRSYSFTGLS